jgi:hypothetical protein
MSRRGAVIGWPCVADCAHRDSMHRRRRTTASGTRTAAGAQMATLPRPSALPAAPTRVWPSLSLVATSGAALLCRPRTAPRPCEVRHTTRTSGRSTQATPTAPRCSTARTWKPTPSGASPWSTAGPAVATREGRAHPTTADGGRQAGRQAGRLDRHRAQLSMCVSYTTVQQHTHTRARARAERQRELEGERELAHDGATPGGTCSRCSADPSTVAGWPTRWLYGTEKSVPLCTVATGR